MDFGKLEDISAVDFRLPPDHAAAIEILKNTPQKVPTVYVGPPVWVNKTWLGKVYPHNSKDNQLLYHYARQFSTIELNVTHYQIPTISTIERWLAAVDGTDFLFCPKWPQIISHDAQLQHCEGQIREFVENISLLKQHLGVTFLQLAPYFTPRQLPVLERFLDHLPSDFPITVEFRNADWFRSNTFWQKTLDMLTERQVGLVITDVAGRRDVLHQSFTTPTLTLRFVGNNLHRTDYTRISEWVQRIKHWLTQGLQTAYVFVHCGENDFAPELTQYWIEQLNHHCNLRLLPPKIQPKIVQGSLF